MDWLKELLKSKGIADEVIEAVVAAAEEKFKNFIPKHRFDEVNEAKKQLEAQLAERDKQLSELKKVAGDNEELKKRIEQLQQENKAKEQEYQAKIRDMAVTTAIKLAVAGDAHDPDLIVNLIDKSKIELDDNGNIKGGLEEQLKALRENKAFLFIQKEPETQPKFKGVVPAEGRDNPPAVIKNPWSKEHFNLTEQARILKENPELAKQLQAQAKIGG
jgi:alanyl-tRNA synthetase